MKFKLAILEQDKIYLERLVAVFSARYADRMEIYAFTDKNVALESIREQRIEVFAAGESFAIDPQELPPRCGFVYFVESPSVETLFGQRAICKYQKAEMIFKQLLSVFTEVVGDTAGFRGNNLSATTVVTVLSASGGTGSSTVAAACAAYGAKMGKKCLYLNLEAMGNSSLFFAGEGQFNFGDVIYSLKGQKQNLLLKLESTVSKDPNGVYFYKPAKTALDILELGSDDIKRLLNEVRVSGGYDYVFVDCGFSLEQRTLEIMRMSGKVVFVTDGSQIANEKFLRAYEALKIMDQQAEVTLLNRIGLFYNRFRNKTSQVIAGLSVKEFGGSPSFEGAGLQQVVEKLSSMGELEKIVNK